MIAKQKLYILPFDHRGSFIKMFGFNAENLTEEKVRIISDYKHIIYEGFLKSIEMGVPKESSAILVDEQFGEKIHKEAKELGITRLLTIEKSGQDEFDFEYGDEFKDHIKKIKPDYVKVLVRYNSHSDKDLNKHQIEKLKVAYDFCKSEGIKFFFELLAVATKDQLESVGGDKERYDKELRGSIMAESIKELQGSKINPDVWKIEGLSDFNQMQKVVEQARYHDKNVGVVVLGRGESEERVKQWLVVAAKIPGVIGFAVGRTVFKQALVNFQRNAYTRQEAIEKIANNYKSFVDLFEKSL